MTDTSLPPGCAKLRVTDDPNTWGNKIVVTDDGIARAAKVVDFDKAELLATWRPFKGSTGFDYSAFSHAGYAAGVRLYDAAPEPVKGREWWICETLSFGGMGRIEAFDSKAAAEEYGMRTHSDPNGYRIVRLIEGDQA